MTSQPIKDSEATNDTNVDGGCNPIPAPEDIIKSEVESKPTINPASRLTSISGKPLVPPTTQPIGLIVIKQSDGSPIQHSTVQALSAITKCNVVVIPMDAELHYAKSAKAELEKIHKHIHVLLGLAKK